MKKSDFYFDLPEELIAQTPIEPRDHSRLLCVDRASGKIEHKHFYDILDMLRDGDTLVVNNSKVIPARLYGHVEGREEAKIELPEKTKKVYNILGDYPETISEHCVPRMLPIRKTAPA